MLIELAAADDRLLEPQPYHRIRKPEDRPCVPAQHLPLFKEKGWRTGAG